MLSQGIWIAISGLGSRISYRYTLPLLSAESYVQITGRLLQAAPLD